MSEDKKLLNISKKEYRMNPINLIVACDLSVLFLHVIMFIIMAMALVALVKFLPWWMLPKSDRRTEALSTERTTTDSILAWVSCSVLDL